MRNEEEIDTANLVEFLSHDIGTLVRMQVSFCDTISSDENLSTLTGIPNLSTLDNIVKVILKVTPQLSLVKCIGKMTIRERVMLIFMKLKHNISYTVLVFNCCTKRNCAKIVMRMLDILSSALRFAIPWPSKKEVLQNMPLCFKDFEDVRVVVDCTEIFIQWPTNLCLQVITYSQYKGSNTIKFMTGVIPGGAISFVSDCYGGRVSDSVIFEQRGLIHLLELTSSQREGIMVDRGFFIDKICSEADVRLVRPSFTRNKK